MVSAVKVDVAVNSEGRQGSAGKVWGGEIAACVVSPTFVPPTRLLVLRRILCAALCRSGHEGRGFEGWTRNAALGWHASGLGPIN